MPTVLFVEKSSEAVNQAKHIFKFSVLNPPRLIGRGPVAELFGG
jgi:hypothetical protein